LSNKLHALITGGSGYLGETLVKDLLKRGYQCSILDLNNPSQELMSSITFHRADITEFNAVDIACNGIDIIFHNVAQVPLANDSNLFDSVNRLGTENIIKAGLKNKCKHLVYTSSSAIYGVPTSNPVTEECSENPQDPYGRSKFEGEKICIDSRGQGMKISVIRPRTIIGRGRLGIFQILFEWVFQGRNVPVFDNGENLYQFIHIDDLSEACILSAEKDSDSEYNVGAIDFCSMRETLEALLEHAKTNSKVRSLPSSVIVPLMKFFAFIRLSPLSPYHALMYGQSFYFDTTKIETELNLKSEFSNKNAIIQSYDWYVQNRESILLNTSTNSTHKSAVKQGILSLVARFL
jgi:nucleoside-diphosphate-sugar epimerase